MKVNKINLEKAEALFLTTTSQTEPKPENKMKKKEKSFSKQTMISMIRWLHSSLSTKIVQHLMNIRFNFRNIVTFKN